MAVTASPSPSGEQEQKTRGELDMNIPESDQWLGGRAWGDEALRPGAQWAEGSASAVCSRVFSSSNESLTNF